MKMLVLHGTLKEVTSDAVGGQIAVGGFVVFLGLGCASFQISGLTSRFWRSYPFLEGVECMGRGCGGSQLHQLCLTSFLFGHLRVDALRSALL